MGDINKTLRIKTNVGKDKFISVNLDSEYDTLEILSLTINQRGAFRYHTSGYGVLVGRVLANNGFGVPNAKLSLFIAKDGNADVIETALYPYTNVSSKNNEGIRYNLLPSNQKDDCHQVVGTFPNKRMVLDDNSVLEVFEKYYRYTTRTNESGDYMFFGIPTGSYTLHMDLDISDCGKLSQRPRDFLYKGYNLEQFENPNQFKIDTELSSLPQIFTQNTTVEIKPFWGDAQEGSNIGITREDINVNYKFEPTCVFMGSIVSDTPNDGITKRCTPTNKMGDMREMVTGSGTIEIIRKTVSDTIEELQIKGKQLIDGNGVWCFQIPMNLDYVMTDEYGNIVPTDDPNKGIPTRCEVRFRVSMDETQSESIEYKRGKILIPHNPQTKDELDYEFGSKTNDNSFKSLMWNGVYTVKSFIPRFQKARNIKTNKFTGIKNVNIHGGNNPMPYNNIRIKIPFMFWFLCNATKLFIRIVQLINNLKRALMSASLNLINLPYAYVGSELCPDLEYWYFAPGMSIDKPTATWVRKFWNWLTGQKPSEGTLCNKWQHESVCLTFKSIVEDLNEKEGDQSSEMFCYFEYIGKGDQGSKPLILTEQEFNNKVTDGSAFLDLSDANLTEQQIQSKIKGWSSKRNSTYTKKENWAKRYEEISQLPKKDKMSSEVKNALMENNPTIKLTPDVSYLMQCVEMNLAQEYEVIKFDFYNDWINGVLYLPRWARQVKYRKKRENGERIVIERVKGCINDPEKSRISRRYVQQCSLSYDTDKTKATFMNVTSNIGCLRDNKLRCHQMDGMDYISVLGGNGGVVREHETMLGDNVYYMIPYEFQNGGMAIPMFATDIVMLGSLFDCNEYGLPSTFDSLINTTYKLPTNMALTNVDDESYSYIDNAEYNESEEEVLPTRNEINSWKCGKGGKCGLNYLAPSGVTAVIPNYGQIEQMIEEATATIGSSTGSTVLEYEDIFPITEMSGIEWGYTGPGQGLSTNDKIYAPGGHFMGLACGNAETNIRSCVNLKRACEIGTTLSERFEVPIGYQKSDEDETYDVANYLFISPNGLISKDQVVDVTFRSAFATMNQNSLRTKVDAVTKHKKYDFMYLTPDSFDGSLSEQINGNYQYHGRIPLAWDSFWDDKDITNNDIVIEQGYTINRAYETRSDDYILFRHGSDAKFLKGNRMPVYKNSFYFYFGIKEGYTALDEFKRQFFASCSKSTIIGKEPNFEYVIERKSAGFKYSIKISTTNCTPPLKCTITQQGKIYLDKNFETINFLVDNELSIGDYVITITDAKNSEVVKNVGIGTNNFSVSYDISSIKDYNEDETRTQISEFASNRNNGGSIVGTFKVNDLKPYNSNESQYEVIIVNEKNNLRVVVGDTNWGKLYDSKKEKLWLFGYGKYRVSIKEATTGDEFLYGTFEVLNGVIPPSIYVGDIKYDDRLNVKTLKDAYNLTYDEYCLIVNTDVLGEPFSLAFNTRGNINGFKEVIAGKPEQVNYGEYLIGDDVILSDEVKGNFKLDINKIYSPSNVNARGPFYYTSYNSNKNVFATYYEKALVESNKVSVELKDKDSYYYMVDNGRGSLIKYTSGIASYNVNSDNGEQVIFGKMEPLNTFINPLSFKAIALMNKDELVFNTNNGFCYVSDNIQSYKDRVLPLYESDNTVLVVTDNIDNGIKRYFNIQNFNNETNLTYSQTFSNQNGNVAEMVFRVNNLNENLSESKYYIVTNNDETFLPFSYDNGFSVGNITNDVYESMFSTLNSFDKNTEDGTINGYLNISDFVDGTSYWAFSTMNVSGGTYDDDMIKNNYYECQVIKPINNRLTFENKKIIFNTNFSHFYTGGTCAVYQWDGNAIVSADEDKNVFDDMKLVKHDEQGLVFKILANNNNPYRYGDMYVENKVKLEGKLLPTSLNYTINIPVTVQETEYNAKIYSVTFNYGNNIEMEVTLNSQGTQDIANSFKNVLVAIDKNDEIIAHTLFNNNATFEFNYDELNNLKTFSVLYVYNYNETNVTDIEVINNN